MTLQPKNQRLNKLSEPEGEIPPAPKGQGVTIKNKRKPRRCVWVYEEYNKYKKIWTPVPHLTEKKKPVAYKGYDWRYRPYYALKE